LTAAANTSGTKTVAANHSGRASATALYSHEMETPMPTNVNMFRFLETSDRQPFAGPLLVDFGVHRAGVPDRTVRRDDLRFFPSLRIKVGMTQKLGPTVLATKPVRDAPMDDTQISIGIDRHAAHRIAQRLRMFHVHVHRRRASFQPILQSAAAGFRRPS